MNLFTKKKQTYGYEKLIFVYQEEMWREKA